MECRKYVIERAMLLTETSKTYEIEILEMLKSPHVDTQKAIVRFVDRTRRFW